jgi:hypothetical protein
MDIHEINKGCQLQLSFKKKVQGDKGFKQVLDRTLAEIHEITSPAPLDYRENIVEKSDNILYLLDEYGRGLSDPRKTLRDIEPLVERIREEVSTIENELAEKIYHDHELDQLLKDVAVTANVAILKFDRGDYI